MKLAVYIFLSVVVLALSSPHVSEGKSTHSHTPSTHTGSVHCGTERWAAKSLSDGSTIDFANPTVATVADLRNMARPSGADNKSGPRTPEETHAYTIHAVLQEYKIENDHDIHIVISDPGAPSTDSMIIEVPDPQCDGVSGDGFTKQFAAVRAELQSKFGTATGGMTPVNTEVTVTGALFFDFLHHQTGVAPNGAELHPDIDITYGTNASPNPVTTGSSPSPPNPTPSPSPGQTTPPTMQQFDTESAAQAHCPSDVVVWLNTRSNLYHRKGHRWYGTTSQGAYVCEQEAIQNGASEGF
jgi:hypothetical protein